jgi:hypothetical protein
MVVVSISRANVFQTDAVTISPVPRLGADAMGTFPQRRPILRWMPAARESYCFVRPNFSIR